MKTERATLSLEASAGPDGFEALAITAGQGNGWTFPAEALQASLALWEGVECFVDHAGGPRSLRDLAGVCAGPRWDAARQAVRLRVRPCGPAGGLLAELGEQMLSETDGPRPRVGFSADLLFSARGRTVERIMQVLSVDLVFNPARGGAFLPAAQRDHSPQGETTMDEELDVKTTKLQEASGEQAAMPAGADELRQRLLETSLSASRLPSAAVEMVRRQFAGRSFTPAELEQALADQRRLVSELAGPRAVQGIGSGRITEMYAPGDQIRAAVHELLGAPRPEGLENCRPAKLAGIRELYTLLTGDVHFLGGCDPARVQLSTTESLPGLLKNALNKLVLVQWEELGRSGYRWWEPLVSVEHFNSLQEITGVLVGEVAALPTVSEGSAYPALAITDSAETGLWGKYGGYVGLTLEMFERDETHKLRQYPRKLASAALRRISALVGACLKGVGPQMADGLNVFHIDHDNLGTDTLSQASWEAASQAIYQQAMVQASGAGPQLALDARYLVVPRALRLAGMEILYPSFAHESNIFSENMQRGQMGDVITCPEFTDANDWAAVADPRLAPGIVLGERFGLLPEIYIADSETNGALFTNDEIRMKVRHWVSVFVADHRPLYKSNVV